MAVEKPLETNRLRWAARRGMLELDLILAPFVETVYDSLPLEEKIRFCSLLECEDQDLFNWLMNKSRPDDPELEHIVDLILERR